MMTRDSVDKNVDHLAAITQSKIDAQTLLVRMLKRFAITAFLCSHALTTTVIVVVLLSLILLAITRYALDHHLVPQQKIVRMVNIVLLENAASSLPAPSV